VKVIMRVSISGTMDGKDWPARGSVADLPDAVAVDMLNAGLVGPAPVDEPERAIVAPVVEKAVRVARPRHQKL
jgi:hypothetical protein